MTNDPKDIVYNLSKEPSPTCCLCECEPNVHVCLWSCPLFDNEKICVECCHVDTLREDIDKRFSAKLGRKITKEEINETCRRCGRNYGMQDESIVPLEFPSEKPGDSHEETKAP